MSEVSHVTATALGMPVPTMPPRPLVRRRGVITSDRIMVGLARIGAVSLITMLVLLLAVLIYAALPSIQTFGWRFLFTSQWRPNELTVPARMWPVRSSSRAGKP